MQFIFILVALSGLLYFLFAKRQFDFFSLAYLSGCDYFMPGFLGYTRFELMLVDEAYLVMIAVLTAIVVGAFIFDWIALNSNPKIMFRGFKLSPAIALALAVIGLGMTVLTTGGILLSPDKSAMMLELNRWSIVWAQGASLGAVLMFAERRWILFSVCMAFLLFLLYIGFRSPLALSVIAIFVIFLSKKGRQRLAVRNWIAGIVGISAAFFLFVYKFLYIALKRGDLGAVAERLTTPDFYLLTISHSEPFTTQAILNEVVRTKFHVGVEHFSGLIYQAIPFSPSLGAKITSFNDLFQHKLFPWVPSGMANNIWAEMWSSGGWALLLLFILFFVMVLGAGSYLIRIRDPIVKGGVALFFSYWAFYIHRNDLLYQVTIEKRVLLLWIFCAGLSSLVVLAARRQYARRDLQY